MKRNVTEVIRRGFDSMLANWPLLLIQIAEAVVFIGIVIGTVIAVILPIGVSAGFGNFSTSGSTDPAQVLYTVLFEHWILLVYIVLAITVLLLVLITIHSFVIAGCARVYVDAERAAGTGSLTTRKGFEAFSGERFLAGAKRSWWVVFWIYNIVWGIAGIIIMLPLVPVPIGIYLLRDSPAAIVVGCGGIALTILVAIPVGFIANLLTRKSIVDTPDSSHGAVEMTRQAWREIRADFGRHLAVAMILTVISFGGSMFIATFSQGLNFGHATPLVVVTLPLQIGLSVISGAFSAAVSGWFLASLAALAAERV